LNGLKATATPLSGAGSAHSLSLGISDGLDIREHQGWLSRTLEQH
jgi:hypothetical protein